MGSLPDTKEGSTGGRESAAKDRYEIALLIGPCYETVAHELLVAVMEFATNYSEKHRLSLGPVGAIAPVEEKADA